METSVLVLLIAILAVSSISMVFNIAYIAHELGWFPHGKRRDVPAEGGGRVELPIPLTRAEHDLNASDVLILHPFETEMRIKAHTEVFGGEEPEARLPAVVSAFRGSPTTQGLEDLIALVDLAAARGGEMKLSGSEVEGIVEAVKELQSQPDREGV